VSPPAAAAAVEHGERRARSRTPARPLTAPRRPRRVSGPARRGQTARPLLPGRQHAAAEAASAQGLLRALRSISDRPLLDRLIRGRAWIAIVAFALIGIVTLQLALLELNAGIGRALEHQQLLQRENAALSIEDSELAAGERVESQASRLGMELVPQGALRFLPAHPGSDIARAAAALNAPAASAEASGANGSATTAATPGNTTASAGASGEASSAGAASSTGAASSAVEAAGAATPAAGGGAQSTGEAAATAPARSEAHGAEAAQAPAATTTPASPAPATPAGAGAPAGAEAAPAGGTRAGPTG